MDNMWRGSSLILNVCHRGPSFMFRGEKWKQISLVRVWLETDSTGPFGLVKDAAPHCKHGAIFRPDTNQTVASSAQRCADYSRLEAEMRIAKRMALTL